MMTDLFFTSLYSIMHKRNSFCEKIWWVEKKVVSLQTKGGYFEIIYTKYRFPLVNEPQLIPINSIPTLCQLYANSMPTLYQLYVNSEVTQG